MHTHDVIESKLSEKPQHVHTRANWSDIGTKALKDAKEFHHKISYILTSTCSKEWTDEWEEIPDKEYSRKVSMRKIHEECKSFGLDTSEEMENYLKEIEKQESELQKKSV